MEVSRSRCFSIFMLTVAMLVLAPLEFATAQDEDGSTSKEQENGETTPSNESDLPQVEETGDNNAENEEKAELSESSTPVVDNPPDSAPGEADETSHTPSPTNEDSTAVSDTAASSDVGSEPGGDVAETKQTAGALDAAVTQPSSASVTKTDTPPVQSKPVVSVEASRSADAMEAETEKKDVETGVELHGDWTRSLLFTAGNGIIRFQPRGWLQPRFELAVNGESPMPDDERFEGTGFSLQRGRVGFQAWLFEFARFYMDTGWKKGTPSLIDYFVDVGPKNGAGAVGVRVGLFRPYFARQLLHSTTKLAMIDYAKAWSDEALGLGLGLSGRQLGIALQGFAKGGLEYGFGVWNGSDGYERDGDLMYGGRFALHPLALAGVGDSLRPGDESDHQASTTPRLSLGLAFYAENRQKVTSDIINSEYDDVQLKGGFDLAFQYAGFSFQGEIFLVGRIAEESLVREVLDRYNREALGVGAYVQLGYMVLKQRLELTGRYDVVDENVEFRGFRHYPAIGLSYFIYGNNLKIQTQYRVDLGPGYKADDPGYIDYTHNILLMLQVAI